MVSLRILIADDEPWIRTGLKSALQRHEGIEIVAEAENGKEAVHLAELSRPDVVLMDIAMPEMSGLEATRRIKSMQPHVKVVILTVHRESAYVCAARAFGADAFILKKLMVTELMRTIERVCSEKPSREAPAFIQHA